MATAKCPSYGLTQLIYREYAAPIVFSIGLLFMAFAVYKFVTAHFRNATKSQSSGSKSLFSLSITYYVVLIVYSIDLIINNKYYCRNEAISLYTGNIAVYLYVIQALLLTFIFLYRLVTIFSDTAYALPNSTVLISAAVTLCNICFGSIAYSFFEFGNQWISVWAALYAFAWFIDLCIVIGLNAVFIRKLFIVHQSCKDASSNEHALQLLTVITKTSILCFASSSITLLSMLLYLLKSAVGSIHFDFISEIVLFCDICTNFACVLLTAKNFKNWYFWLCDRCHRRLVFCCNLYIKGNESEMSNIVIHAEMSQKENVTQQIAPVYIE